MNKIKCQDYGREHSILSKDGECDYMWKWKNGIIRLLNKFCFCKWHDHNCCGCIFKNFEKCPVNMIVEKLE